MCSEFTPDEWCRIENSRNLHGMTWDEWLNALSEDHRITYGDGLDEAAIRDEYREYWRLGWDWETIQKFEAWEDR